MSDPIFAPNQIVDAAFNYFRGTGFPYRDLPLHVCMQEINQLAATADKSLIQTKVGYQIGDTYHPHRFAASAIDMIAPLTAFESDKLLRRSLTLEQRRTPSGEATRSIPTSFINSLCIVSGTQACSNFRPGFACHLYRKYCKAGDTVLDTSTGYGGRLIGYAASRVDGAYIGIDPNTQTHAANERMALDLGIKNVELICLPAEDVDVESLRGRCDFAFTSPPYFCKEIYSDEPTQSCNRYSTGEAWRIGFLVSMLRLQFAALKPGSTSIINIADVKIGSTTYPLAGWTINAAIEVGFDYIKTDAFPLIKRIGARMSKDIAVEPVIVLRKPFDGVRSFSSMMSTDD